MSDNLPKISAGKRAIISGRTGSGKSTLGCWLLNRSLQHWVIFNPKCTDAYDRLSNSETINGFDENKISKSLIDNQFTIINFKPDESTHEFMDACVQYFHDAYDNIGLCIDELYTLHGGNAKAGSGLTAWLTRGRERKQSFLGLTQRPAWISRFCYSESDYIGSMVLTMIDDRKSLVANSGCEYFMEKLEDKKWLWYEVSKDRATKYGAVPLIKKSESA